MKKILSLALLLLAAPVLAQTTRDCVTQTCQLVTGPDNAPTATQCRLYDGTVLLETLAVSGITTARVCNFTPRNFAAGSHTLTARFLDAAGQESGPSNVVTFTSAPPLPPPPPAPTNLRIVTTTPPPVGAVLFSDAFNRVNETPLAGAWAAPRDPWRLASNAITPAPGVDAWSYVATVTPPANQYAEVTLHSLAGDGAGPAVRIATTGNTLYAIEVKAATLQVVKFTADVYAGVGAAESHAHVPGDRYRLTVVGTTLRMFKNGTQVGADRTDTSIAAGRFGVWGYGPVVADNFEGGGAS